VSRFIVSALLEPVRTPIGRWPTTQHA